jgi:hypothetical protein
MLPIMLNVMVAAGTNAHIGAPHVPPVDPRITSAMEQSPTIIVYATQPTSPTAGQAFVVWPDLDKPFIMVARNDGTLEMLAIPVPTKPVIAQEYRLSEYIGFVLLLFLGIAIAFQMPLVVVLLGWLGLASVDWLRSKRRYALFICGIVSAVITPSTDVISMLVMLVPLYGLYELGILLLTIAPASKVAEGKVLSWKRPKTKADKRSAPGGNPVSSAQMDGTVSRQSTAAQHTGSAVDDEGTGP